MPQDINPPWFSNTPRRTGADTFRKLLFAVCGLLAVWGPTMKQFLPEDRHVYIDAVNQACSDALANIPNPNQNGR